MVASSTSSSPSPASLQTAFLLILPRVELHAQFSHRAVKCADQRADCIAETVALAFQWFVRLTERGKDASQYASALATYAARAVRCGRRLTGVEKAKDVMSPCAQRKHGFRVERLPVSPRVPHENLYAEPDGQRKHDEWEERLQDNTLTPPPEQAAFRLDFRAWLRTLTARERRLVKAMARNERTMDLSKQFDLSSGRISQLRRQFKDHWDQFCADQPAVATA
jgi:hypothetical protein